MNHYRFSRRGFLASGAAAAALVPALSAATAQPKKTKVWVQLTTGGRPYPPTYQEMFLDRMFLECEIWPVDQPDMFSNYANTGYASGVTNAPPTSRGAL